MSAVGVLVATREPLLRLGIRTACRDGGLEVHGEAGDGRSLRIAAERLRRQCVIVAELGTLEPDAAGAVRDLTASHRVLLLDAIGLDRPRLIRAGASGFVPSRPDTAALCAAVRAADGGDLVLPATAGSAPASCVDLTPREREVLACLAAGGSTAVAARELHMSATTLKTHLRNANAKLGTSSRAAATAHATALGLLPDTA